MGLTAWNFPFAYVELIRSRPETEAEIFFKIFVESRQSWNGSQKN
jgi:hypothetical protein